MRIDLDTRLTLGFVFGLVGLAVELGCSLLGLPVSAALMGTFGSIVLGTFGVGVIAQSASKGREEEED